MEDKSATESVEAPNQDKKNDFIQKQSEKPVSKSFLDRIQLPKKEQQDTFRCMFKNKYNVVEEKIEAAPEKADFRGYKTYRENQELFSSNPCPTYFSSLNSSQKYYESRIIDDEIEMYFEDRNKATYEKQPNWVLPDVNEAYSSPPYEFEEFESSNTKVHEELNKIVEGCTGEEWEAVVQQFWLGPRIVRGLKKSLYPQIIVKNWVKVYELFSTYPIVTSGKLNSVHIGDQHGGTVMALNHFLHSKFGEVNWNWRATAENPYYEDDYANL